MVKVLDEVRNIYVEKHVDTLQKRDGTVVPFNQEKITKAIEKAVYAVEEKEDRSKAKRISDRVLEKLEKGYDGYTAPTVERIQDTVEEAIMESGESKIAKAYIIYRQERAKLREEKEAILGVRADVKLSLNSIKVLQSRYLRRDDSGKIVETPGMLFRRVAHNIASADEVYDESVDIEKLSNEFYDMMSTLEFLPNSPTLMNAGCPLQQLSACFVLPVPDNMEGIFDSIKYTALVHQSGGGTGFDFSRLRPKNDIVLTTMGKASGPVSFMQVFNRTTETVKQGGKRRGANMGILRVDHPDIIEFITAKEVEGNLNNFNISVAITDKFMQALEKDEEYDLINPRDGKPASKMDAQKVWDLIVTMAWKNGEPGIIFIDKMNKDNPTPQIGKIESTNPCGEQPLLPFEACNLGSVNLSKMVKYHDGKQHAEMDWDKLRKTVHLSIHFMDNVIDKSNFPLDKITKMVKANRKLGFGVMGFADMLIQLGIPYNSEKALEIGEKIMKFINDESKKESLKIAEQRGMFPNYKGSTWEKKNMKLRNATTTTIAPTGTIGVIAQASGGIEPLFAISYIRAHVLGEEEMLEVNPLFEKIAKERGFYSGALMRKISEHGSIHGMEEVPGDIQKIFVTAHDISPEWHVKMQAAFQKHTDNAVSKTINFPSSATTKEIEEAFLLAYKLGCKGITIYRDKSREMQVLNIGEMRKKPEQDKKEEKEEVPIQRKVVKVAADYAGGCPKCSL